MALRDDIRSLPGHPPDTEETDLIVPVLTNVRVQVPKETFQ